MESFIRVGIVAKKNSQVIYKSIWYIRNVCTETDVEELKEITYYTNNLQRSDILMNLLCFAVKTSL